MNLNRLVLHVLGLLESLVGLVALNLDPLSRLHQPVRVLLHFLVDSVEEVPVLQVAIDVVRILVEEFPETTLCLIIIS